MDKYDKQIATLTNGYEQREAFFAGEGIYQYANKTGQLQFVHGSCYSIFGCLIQIKESDEIHSCEEPRYTNMIRADGGVPNNEPTVNLPHTKEQMEACAKWQRMLDERFNRFTFWEKVRRILSIKVW